VSPDGLLLAGLVSPAGLIAVCLRRSARAKRWTEAQGGARPLHILRKEWADFVNVKVPSMQPPKASVLQTQAYKRCIS
jgi:hypothetical protein